MKTKIKANHTPGPWRLFGSSICQIKEIGGREILHGSYIRGRNSDIEIKANSSLIAAAPEMLYNLKRMVTCLGEHLLEKEAEKNGVSVSSLCPCLSELQQAQSVIRKAEGGE